MYSVLFAATLAYRRKALSSNYLEFVVDDLGVGGLFKLGRLIVPAGGDPVIGVNLPFSAGAR